MFKCAGSIALDDAYQQRPSARSWRHTRRSSLVSAAMVTGLCEVSRTWHLSSSAVASVHARMGS